MISKQYDDSPPNIIWDEENEQPRTAGNGGPWSAPKEKAVNWQNTTVAVFLVVAFVVVLWLSATLWNVTLGRLG